MERVRACRVKLPSNGLPNLYVHIIEAKRTSVRSGIHKDIPAIPVLGKNGPAGATIRRAMVRIAPAPIPKIDWS